MYVQILLQNNIFHETRWNQSNIPAAVPPIILIPIYVMSCISSLITHLVVCCIVNFCPLKNRRTEACLHNVLWMLPCWFKVLSMTWGDDQTQSYIYAFTSMSARVAYAIVLWTWIIILCRCWVINMKTHSLDTWVEQSLVVMARLWFRFCFINYTLIFIMKSRLCSHLFWKGLTSTMK